MSIYLRNIFRFIILIFIQVLILNKIPLRWWANPGIPSYTPYIYPLFILLLPIATPTWFTMITAFILGITMDSFMDTGGIHAMACVFMAFVRLKVLAFLLPKKLNEYKTDIPNVETMGGWSPFLTYSAILLFLHLSLFYLIEIWSFKSIGYLLLKLLFSLVSSLIFIILYSLIFRKSIKTQYYEN